MAQIRRRAGGIELLHLLAIRPGACSIWITYVRSFEVIGGVPELVVAGQRQDRHRQRQLLRSWKSTGPTLESSGPLPNRHPAPARPRKPRDKAKVEQAVLIVERWLLGRLRRWTCSPASLTSHAGARRTHDAAQRKAGPSAQARRHPPPVARGDRPPGAQGAAQRALRIQRVACAGSASTITSTSTLTIILSPTALRPRRGRGVLTACGVEIFHSASASPFICAQAGTGSTTTAEHEPSSGATPAGRSSASGKTPARSARRPRRFASKSWKVLHPSEAYRACSGIVRLVGSFGAARASRPLPSAPSRSASGPMARSNPSSMPGSIGGPRQSARRTPPRSFHPTSAGRATTTRRRQRAQTSNPRRFTPSAYGMAKAFADLAADQAKDLAHADCHLRSTEASWRRDKRLTARLRAAKLRQQASIEDVDYRAARGLDRALFQKLSEGEWIDAHDNLVPGRPVRSADGLFAPSARKPVATPVRPRHRRLRSRGPGARPETAAIRASSNPSAALICSFSTTSA